MNSVAALGETPTRPALSAIPLFSDIADELLRSVAEAGRAHAYTAGHVVFRRGDPGDCLYSVLSGELRAFTSLDDGSELDLQRLKPGDSFGELALLDGGPRSNTVEALTDCHVFSVSREAFLDALPQSPRLIAAVLSNLVAYVRTSSERLLRQELEQRAIRAEMEVERLRALTQMVSGVAHEINTPLGIVNTAASVVTQRIASDALTRDVVDPRARAALEDVREAVDLIQANIRRAHGLVGNFKRLSVSQIADVKEALSIADVVRDAVGLFAINARQAKLDIQVLDALDDGGQRWIGYRGFLTQVILNLLTNVERYGYPDGTGGRVEVVVAEAARDPEFTIVVRDFGCGMPPDAVSRVFEPFYTTGRSKGATGLGMSIVHNLVTSVLKGRIQLASEPGGGTAVTVAVPKAIPD